MRPAEDSSQPPSNTAHRVARLLRHEVSDLLQSIYSTVAILLDRLPEALAQERRLLGDLKSRAEICRDEMDVTVDLLSPLEPSIGRVELQAAVAPALAQARRRYPALPVQFESEGGLAVNADAQALTGVLTILLVAVCQAARKMVKVQLTRNGEFGCCTFERDGLAVSNEHLAWLDQPFATTQQALFGLALAFARRVVETGGGSVAIANRPEGGLCVRLLFPAIGA